MNIFKTNTEDSVYWLKVAMRQAQADIKSLKSEVELLKIENKYLRNKCNTNSSDVVNIDNK